MRESTVTWTGTKPDGARELPLMSKDDVADAILDEILKRRK